jgi:3-dehydrosphinganine reductase
MNPYHNKLVLISGGSSGIGLALAKHLASLGSNVWIMARRLDQLEIARKEIEGARKSLDQIVGTLSIDISNREQVFSALADFTQQNGTPDYLANCAGITYPGLFEDISPEIFDQMMNVNVLGTVNVIKAILPGMIQKKTGHIIIIGSGAGLIGTIGYSAYGASKFALRGLADVLRVELKPHGIRVSLVAPGDTQTPQLDYENQFKPAITRAFVGNNSKVQSAEYVADVIARDVARGRYIITPGFDVSLYYNLANTFGIVYPIVDMLMSQAWKQVNSSKNNRGQ